MENKLKALQTNLDFLIKREASSTNKLEKLFIKSDIIYIQRELEDVSNSLSLKVLLHQLKDEVLKPHPFETLRKIRKEIEYVENTLNILMYYEDE